jgi:prepilin-type N-terminal cleavage/methylation domain-containing protein
MRQQRLLHDQTGFTLIEVLIAMALLSFGLLSVASMQVVAVQVNTSSQRLALATTLVQDKVEKLMALPFGDTRLDDNTPVGTFQLHPYTDDPTDPSPPPGYTLTWQVDDAGDSKTVIVTAGWMKYGEPKEFALSFTKTMFQ